MMIRLSDLQRGRYWGVGTGFAGCAVPYPNIGKRDQWVYLAREFDQERM
jgi:hypothetical protein